MGNKRLYIMLVIVGGIAAVVGIFMMRSANLSLHNPGKVLGWGGIAVLLIARLFFARRRLMTTQPPKK